MNDPQKVLAAIKEIAENARFRFEADGIDGLSEALREIRELAESALR